MEKPLMDWKTAPCPKCGQLSRLVGEAGGECVQCTMRAAEVSRLEIIRAAERDLEAAQRLLRVVAIRVRAGFITTDNSLEVCDRFSVDAREIGEDIEMRLLQIVRGQLRHEEKAAMR